MADEFCKVFNEMLRRRGLEGPRKGRRREYHRDGRLFNKLFIDGIQLITKLKNIAQIEHSRHHSFSNFIVNLIGGIAAYCLFPKKPMINLECVYDN